MWFHLAQRHVVTLGQLGHFRWETYGKSWNMCIYIYYNYIYIYYNYIRVCVCRVGNVGSTIGNGDFQQQKLGRQNEVVLASKSGVGTRRNAGLNPILAGHL